MPVVERVWEWRFPIPPETLWPYLLDTARINEALGLPRYAVTDTAQPDGTVRRTGATRRMGLRLSWDEGVPQWVANRFYTHRRQFHGGPVRSVQASVSLEPQLDGGTAARYRLRIETGGLLGALLVRLGLKYRFGPTLDRLFREGAGFAAAGEPAEYETEPPSIPAAVRRRVQDIARGLTDQGYGVADDLAAYLLNASDPDLQRMRPRALARRWGAEPRVAIETCLAAARAGLLHLRWDLLCPRCRGAKLVAPSLDRLPQGAHCPSCNIDYDRDFTQNVEVTFEPAADIRAIGIGGYCLSNALDSAHIKIQHPLAPGEAVTLAAHLPDGDYRARTIEPGGSADFRVEGGIAPAIALTDGDPLLAAGAVPGEIAARNDGGSTRTLVVEDRGWAADALTAHEVTTMQAFRDMFADAVLRPGDQVEIRRVALLFTDIKGSSELYNRVGDARAYGWVREHYAVLTGAVRRHDGAVVKTIGDAVMAAFASPLDALRAALAMRDDIAGFNRELGAEHGELVVKLGLHCGPCIAVTLNDRLDYFGRTVNLAARLQGESQGGDIVVSAAMAAEAGIAELLDPLGAEGERAWIKGFGEPVPLRRVPAWEKAGC
ncbi:MAG TPA: adenylate/guanylate cyclase domain-containing protein [Stellaceae bacterium]|nr:adenylate/guanylate cyclase domain-containing protein [Stellaceae bacterium]